jgi:hypothetical protein
MTFVETDSHGGTPAGAATDSLSVLLVYEDLTTGLRARRAFEAAVQQPELEADFSVDLWRFDLLREPALLRMAANQASKADIVFLSAHGYGVLPAAVDLWLRQWLEQRGGEPSALVVLLDDVSGEDAAANQALRALRARAVAAGAEVFLQAGELFQAQRPFAFDDLQRHPEAVTMMPEQSQGELERHAHRDWGINE